MHYRCRACHLKTNRQFPTLHKFEKCEDCHASLEKEPELVNPQRQFSLSVSTNLKDSRINEAYSTTMFLSLEEKGFCPQTSADINAAFDFVVERCSDDLVKHHDSTILAQGSCKVTISYKEQVVATKSFISRVFLGESEEAVYSKILGCLERTTSRYAVEEIDRIDLDTAPTIPHMESDEHQSSG